MVRLSIQNSDQGFHRDVEEALWDGGIRDALQTKVERVRDAIERETGRSLSVKVDLTDDGHRVVMAEPGGHDAHRREVVFEALMADSLEFFGNMDGFCIKVSFDTFDPTKASSEEGGWTSSAKVAIPRGPSGAVWSKEQADLMGRIENGVDWSEFGSLMVAHLLGRGERAPSGSGIRASAR
jgi:hypothetical protein